MKLDDLQESAKSNKSAHVCAQCAQPITNREYRVQKGKYYHTRCTAVKESEDLPAATPAPTNKSNSALTAEQKAWLDANQIKNFVYNPATQSLDVKGNVFIFADKNLTQLPVRFGRVDGNFSVANTGLTTLAGCPHTVKTGFDCSGTAIADFTGGPTTVDGYYFAKNMPNLTSLHGLPEIVRSTLNLDGTKNVTSLDGLPPKIGALVLPPSIVSLKGIHRKTRIRNYITITANPSDPGCSNWLGVLMVEPLRDGIHIPQDSDLEAFFNAVLVIRGRSENPAEDGVRDVLAAQEKMIDAGYAKIARL